MLDGDDRTLHNLASLLLTNTTLRSATSRKGGWADRFFNKQQPISVGTISDAPDLRIRNAQKIEVLAQKKYRKVRKNLPGQYFE
jgi:hypothetical protein